MSVNVLVKFPGVEETILMKNVPYNTTISTLKKKICKATKFEGDEEKVRLIQIGKILDLNSQVGSLSLDSEQQVQIFVTGIKSRQKQQQAPEPQPNPRPQHPNNEPLPNIPPRNNFNQNIFNNNNQQPQNGYMFGRRINNNNNNNFGHNRNDFLTKRNIILFVVFAIISALITYSFLNAKHGPRKPKFINFMQKASMPRKPFTIRSLLNLKTLAFIFVILLFSIPLFRIRWNAYLFKQSVYFFFRSMLPTFSNAEIGTAGRRI